MIDIPKDRVVRKIMDSTGLTQQEVEDRISEKMKQLSGLISEDGAAHIVANDLGVQLYKTEGHLKISELTPAAKNAIIVVKVLKKYEVREFSHNGRKGRVANALVGDDSGRMRIVFWNDQVDRWELLKEGDILRISNPFIKDNNGRFEIHLNDRSTIDVNPPGVSVELPADGFSSRKREAKYLKDITGNEEEVEVLGTIVQVFDPNFFMVCPECNRKVGDNDHCPVHGAVSPVLNYVTSCYLDDGTSSMRVTFWKAQTQKLFGLEDDEIVKWKDDPSLVAPHKHELLGEIVKIIGRPRRNEQFDRMDLTADLVFKDVDPEAELAKLESQVSESETPAGSSEDSPSSFSEGSASEDVSGSSETGGDVVLPDSDGSNESSGDGDIIITEDVVSIDDL